MSEQELSTEGTEALEHLRELVRRAEVAEDMASHLEHQLEELRRKHQYQPAPGTYLVRTTRDAQGNSLGRAEPSERFPKGEELIGYRARDTGEVVWRGTFEDVFAWDGSRTGIEPFDRHQHYWERRYAARRYARRVGTLPTYSDLWQEHVQAISLLRDIVYGLQNNREPADEVLDKVREQYMHKPLVYDQERV